MNYYDTHTGYVQPLQNNSSLNSFNTYRQYDEYCGTRQDDLMRFMYQYPSLAYTYDPWTNSVMMPPPPPKKEIKKVLKQEQEEKDKNKKPEIKKEDKKTEVKKEVKKPEMKKEISATSLPSKMESSEPSTMSKISKFSWQKMFTNTWDFLKMPFED